MTLMITVSYHDPGQDDQEVLIMTKFMRLIGRIYVLKGGSVERLFDADRASAFHRRCVTLEDLMSCGDPSRAA